MTQNKQQLIVCEPTKPKKNKNTKSYYYCYCYFILTFDRWYRD
jgi:hypothetical protein